jgi:XTP/dITP diphosphohydrolase
VRMQKPGVAAAVVAVAALTLSGCGTAGPGVAAKVGDQTVTSADVNRLSEGYCRAFEPQISAQGQAVPMRLIRGFIAGSLTLRAAGEQLAAANDITVPDGYVDRVKSIQTQAEAFPAAHRDEVVEVGSAGAYVTALERQLGGQLLLNEGTPDANDDAKVARGRDELVVWLGEHHQRRLHRRRHRHLLPAQRQRRRRPQVLLRGRPGPDVHRVPAQLPTLRLTVAEEPADPLADFRDDMRRLRAECAWKREQTHESLRRYLVEESSETLEAIDSGDPDHLREELGDLLLQVAFHAVIAEEAGEFTFDDVVRGIVAKLRRRNPHVFGDPEDRPTAGDARSVNELWESVKATEKPRASVFDGLPPGLPALLLADKVLDRAERAGTPLAVPVGDDVGDRLLALVAEARGAGVDPEHALRDAVRRALP